MVGGGGANALITTALLYHVGHVVSTLWQGYVPAAYKLYSISRSELPYADLLLVPKNILYFYSQLLLIFVVGITVNLFLYK